MKHLGFSLLEVVIALALGAAMIVLLYQGISQARRIMTFVEVTVDDYHNLALAQERLTKDISSAFNAMSHTTPHEEKEKKEETSKEEKNSFIVEAEPFLMSCISTSPLVIHNQNKPRKVRVIYTLEKDKTTNLLTLWRFESEKLTLDVLKKDLKDTKGYAILDSLREFSVELITYEKKDDKQELQKTRTWSSTQREEEKKEALLPDAVAIKGIIADQRKKREIPFSFLIPIYGIKKFASRHKEFFAKKEHDKQIEPALHKESEKKNDKT